MEIDYSQMTTEELEQLKKEHQQKADVFDTIQLTKKILLNSLN